MRVYSTRLQSQIQSPKPKLTLYIYRVGLKPKSHSPFSQGIQPYHQHINYPFKRSWTPIFDFWFWHPKTPWQKKILQCALKDTFGFICLLFLSWPSFYCQACDNWNANWLVLLCFRTSPYQRNMYSPSAGACGGYQNFQPGGAGGLGYPRAGYDYPSSNTPR